MDEKVPKLQILLLTLEKEGLVIMYLKKSLLGMCLCICLSVSAFKKVFKGKTHEAIFTEIYTENFWKDAESVSGTGSNEQATSTIRDCIPKLFQDLSIRSILDVPCGDFNWMKLLNLEGITYTGIDIVKKLVDENKKQFGTPFISFHCMNAVYDDLPKADLILCRDMIVHMSLKDGLRALKNFKRSGAKYILITTFTKKSVNEDISSGRWTKRNLQVEPFNFPKPLQLISENSPEEEGADKFLGLWDLNDIQFPEGV